MSIEAVVRTIISNQSTEGMGPSESMGVGIDLGVDACEDLSLVCGLQAGNVDVQTGSGTGLGSMVDDAAFEAERKENANQRSAILAWLRTNPLYETFIIHHVLSIVERMLKAENGIGSNVWELEQMKIELEAINADPRLQPRGRSVPVLEAARMSIENDYEQLWLLLTMQGVMWEQLLPPAAHTKWYRCLAFLVLSRSRCQVEMKQRCRTRKFPIRFSLVSDGPNLCDEIAATPTCVFDPWTKQQVELAVGVPKGLGGEIPQARARLAARVANKTSAQLKQCMQSFAVAFTPKASTRTRRTSRKRQRNFAWKGLGNNSSCSSICVTTN